MRILTNKGHNIQYITFQSSGPGTNLSIKKIKPLSSISITDIEYRIEKNNLEELQRRNLITISPYVKDTDEIIDVLEDLTGLVSTIPINITVGDIKPPTANTGDLWYQTLDKTWYTYDDTIWVSNDEKYLLFTRNGNTDGNFLNVGTITSSQAGYRIVKNARLRRISAYATGGPNSTKNFEIRKLGSIIPVFSFSLLNYTYSNNSLNEILNSDDILQCFCSSTGQPVRNPSVTCVICWVR